MMLLASGLDKWLEPERWYLPVRGSQYAAEVDQTFYFEYAILAFFGALIYFLTIYYCIKYRRKNDDYLPPHIRHNYPLEIFWTVVPTLICFGMFYVGAGGYLDVMGAAPKDARIVNVYGQQWSWQFTQENVEGKLHDSTLADDNSLILEVNKPVQLRMISRDVLHSLFIPGMREKMDVVPNRFTTLNILPIREGTYEVFCTEYCGDKHSMMINKCRVVDTETYNKLTKVSGINPYNIYKSNCSACHTLDGTSPVGPTWKGMWHRIEKVKDASGKSSEIKVDAAYIEESIRKPGVSIVQPKGSVSMAAFSESAFSKDNVQALIKWIEQGTFEKDMIYDPKTGELVKKAKK